MFLQKVTLAIVLSFLTFNMEIAASRPSSEQSKVVAKFFQKVDKGKLDEAVKMLHQKRLVEGDEVEARTKLIGIIERTNQRDGIKLMLPIGENPAEDRDYPEDYLVALKIVFNNKETAAVQVTLAKENMKWKIVAIRSRESWGGTTEL